MRNTLLALLILLSALLGGCTQSIQILEGASHAKGRVHIEGYVTDSQADLELCKVPASYTAEEAKTFCSE